MIDVETKLRAGLQACFEETVSQVSPPRSHRSRSARAAPEGACAA